MNSVQMDKLYKILDSKDFQNRYVAFFGANKITELAIRHLEGKGIKTDAIIDNDKNKSKTTKYGVIIDTPDNILGKYREDAIIFIASRYVKEMTKQLEDMGYVQGKHIFATIYQMSTLSLDELEDNISLVKDGHKVYCKLMADTDNTKLFICPYKGIGDIYFIGAYFNEYCKKQGISDYIFAVVGNVCKRVADMFGINNITVLSQEDMDVLVKYIGFIGVNKTNAKILNHNAMHFNILSPFEVAGRIDWGEMFINGILAFESKVAAATPLKKEVKLPDIIDKGKTAIIAPYANTVGNIEMSVWEKITERLKEKGYTVITNSIGNSEPAIKGSYAMSFSLEEAVSIVEMAGIFIGLRSGLCDIISSAKADKIILYPDKASEFFSIKKMGLSEDMKEYCIQGLKEDEIVELIVKDIV